MHWDQVSQLVTDAIEANFDQQISETQKLIRIPSLRGSENEGQDFVEGGFQRLGLTVDRWEINTEELKQSKNYGIPEANAGPQENVVGTYEPTTGKGRSLILNGHIDVVPIGPAEQWERDPWSGYASPEWIYGRGAGDMKAGLIANMFALQAIFDAGLEPQSKLILQSVVEEESTGNGTIAALQRGYEADAVLISEPEDDSLVRANTGVLWLALRVTGQPAHPRIMTDGSNAIEYAFEVFQSLKFLEEAWNSEKGSYEFFEDVPRPINFNLGKISGGDWASSVPGWCELSLRISTFPGVSPEDALAEVRAHVAEFNHDSLYKVSVEPSGFFADGYVLDPGGDAENLLAQCHQQVAGSELETITTPGYLDASLFVNHGTMPTLVYGPYTENIHSFDERVSIESLKQCTKTIALFVAFWCGVEPAEARDE